MMNIAATMMNIGVGIGEKTLPILRYEHLMIQMYEV
jgi:hypothetical protein